MVPASHEDTTRTLHEILELRVLLLVLHRLELDLFLLILEGLRAAHRGALAASPKLLDVVELWSRGLGFSRESVARAPSLAEKTSSAELASYDDVRDAGSTP